MESGTACFSPSPLRHTAKEYIQPALPQGATDDGERLSPVPMQSRYCHNSNRFFLRRIEGEADAAKMQRVCATDEGENGLGDLEELLE